jgi:hypothetical protein
MVHPIITAAGWIDDDRFLDNREKLEACADREYKKTLLCCPRTKTRGNNNSNSRR